MQSNNENMSVSCMRHAVQQWEHKVSHMRHAVAKGFTSSSHSSKLVLESKNSTTCKKLKSWWTSIPKIWGQKYHLVISKLVTLYQKCLNFNGNYVEKYKIICRFQKCFYFCFNCPFLGYMNMQLKFLNNLPQNFVSRHQNYSCITLENFWVQILTKFLGYIFCSGFSSLESMDSLLKLLIAFYVTHPFVLLLRSTWELKASVIKLFTGRGFMFMCVFCLRHLAASLVKYEGCLKSNIPYFLIFELNVWQRWKLEKYCAGIYLLTP